MPQKFRAIHCIYRHVHTEKLLLIYYSYYNYRPAPACYNFFILCKKDELIVDFVRPIISGLFVFDELLNRPLGTVGIDLDINTNFAACMYVMQLYLIEIMPLTSRYIAIILTI